MKIIHRPFKELLQESLDDPIGFDGKKLAEISNKKFLETLKK